MGVKETTYEMRMEGALSPGITAKRSKTSKPSTERGMYLYGVIPTSQTKGFDFIGLNETKVSTVPFQDISAVVSPSPIQEYTLTEENVMMHQEVLTSVMKEYTVIPAEFGTVITDEAVLKNIMKKSYSAIKECMRLVDGRCELGLKAVLKAGISLTPVDRSKVACDFLDLLRCIADKVTDGDLFSQRLILNVSFLVETGIIDEFSREIERLREKYADTMRLLYTGPWPPYSFVYIKISGDNMSFQS